LSQGSALAITSDSAYVLTLQAKEAEQIELVKQGRASPVAKNPELSAVLSFVAVSTVAVAGMWTGGTNRKIKRGALVGPGRHICTQHRQGKRFEDE
jgi:hypothetical protein